MKKSFFAVATVCGCAFFARAEQVQNWFSGGVASSTPTVANGAWAFPSEGVTTNAASFTLELDYDETLDFTPTASAAPDTNVMTRVTVTAAFAPAESGLPTFQNDVKTALIISNNVYCAYANGVWVELTGAVTPPANEDELVVVLSEVDYKRSTSCARFGIITGNGATTNYLKAVGAADDSWIDLGVTTPDPALIGKVSFFGEGELKSVSGDVQMGVASYNNVKYPTVQEAVNAAGTTVDAKVTVLRDNRDQVVIAEGQKIELDTNGKTCGSLVNESDTPVKVDIALDAETVAEGSGAYTNAEAVSGKTTINVRTTDTSKEAYGRVFEEGGTNYLEIVVRTSSNVLNNVKFDGKAVAPADNVTYRAFLATYCGDKSGAYMKANTTAGEITTQLGANGGNGLPLWESYVLDLDPTKPTSKPAAVVSPTTQSTSGMVLTVPTYKATLPTSNYTVEYKLLDVTANTNAVITPTQIVIPFDGHQYRVDTVIK